MTLGTLSNPDRVSDPAALGTESREIVARLTDRLEQLLDEARPRLGPERAAGHPVVDGERRAGFLANQSQPGQGTLGSVFAILRWAE